MTITAKPLQPGVQLATIVGPVITAPAGTTYVLKRTVLTNTTAAAVTVSAYRVASGGTFGASNQVIASRILAPSESYVSPELAGMTLAPGDTLQAVASAANAVSIVSSGVAIV